MLRRSASAGVALALLAPDPLLAQDLQGGANGGDTAWILVSSALVLLMTLPGLGLFYGGLVRAKNFLSVLLQIAAVAATVSVLWVAAGYRLAFGDVASGWIGGGHAWLLAGLPPVRSHTALPENAFALFQMTFAAITPALMVGAWVDRARFTWVVGFCALWSIVVYAPVAHWIWGGGWMAAAGVLDFAGGIVVHTTAGVSALVVALLLGRRTGFPRTLMLPHSPSLTMVGAMLLWVGWFGFNGGSALAANGGAAGAIINTHAAACVAAIVWVLIERYHVGKPTTVGFATGAIAGLAAVTPATGFIAPGSALLFGAASSVICYMAIQIVKLRWHIDDSLDVFAVHGMGGISGSLLLAVFIAPALGGVGYAPGAGMASQLQAQAMAVGVVALWSAIATFLIARAVALVAPMRVSEDEEREGLDITSHGERAWELE